MTKFDAGDRRRTRPMRLAAAVLLAALLQAAGVGGPVGLPNAALAQSAATDPAAVPAQRAEPPRSIGNAAPKARPEAKPGVRAGTKASPKSDANPAAKPRAGAAADKAAAGPSSPSGAPGGSGASGPCRGLQGLALEQCRQCDLPGKSGVMRDLCRTGVDVRYCASRALKDDPDCRNRPAPNAAP